MRQHVSDKIAAAGFILGGLLIISSGITHPNADHSGGILEQPHSMVADPKWILSSLLLAGAYPGITVGLARLVTEGRVHVVAPAVSVAATIGAVLYLFGPSVEDGIVDGNWFSVLMWTTHLVTNPMWGLMVVAVVAVVAVGVAAASVARSGTVSRLSLPLSVDSAGQAECSLRPTSSRLTSRCSSSPDSR